MEASINFLQDPAVQSIEKKATDIKTQADVFLVTTHEQEQAGVEFIRAIKTLKKDIEDTFGPIKKKTHEAWKESVAQENKHLAPLEAAEKNVRGKICAYQDEQERLQRAEQERLAEIARKEQQKKIDAAAKRVNALLEKSVDIAEQINGLEEERERMDLTEEDMAAIDHKLNMLKLKQENIGRGIQQKQSEAERAQYAAPVPVVPPPAPKVQGTSSKKIKKAVINDSMTLIRAIAAGTVAVGIITFDMKVLDKMVNAGAIIPGVGYTEDRSLTVR